MVSFRSGHCIHSPYQQINCYKISSNSFNFIKLNYTSIIQFKKITPNLGIWWYFFTEIFEFFNNFYLMVFNLYSFIFIIPLTIKFADDTTFTIWMCIGFIIFSKQYPVIADITLFYSLLIIFKKYFSKLKFSPIVSYMSLFIILLLLPIFYRVWMISNSGNANFFYAIGLVLSLIEIIIMSDFIWSKIQVNWYLENSVDLKKNVKLTQM
ncbi:unnamed protein product [Ambrosiozyma monospora]|uniref:Unnamed protein product n=1 Tax=Ambrosiozyma monospora TaxID=43982 RepID=A0ACB5SU94_AMBMO|nr:unnamed protein product [Ambrosiozyma monospora]